MKFEELKSLLWKVKNNYWISEDELLSLGIDYVLAKELLSQINYTYNDTLHKWSSIGYTDRGQKLGGDAL